MKYDNVLFDLDGTLTDSSLGITKCAALALDHYQIPYKDMNELSVFIGPPLRKTFAEFGIPEEELQNAIEIFRGRYTTVGKFENEPYAGIAELLEQLKKDGVKCYVATSKPETVAISILEKFDLAKHFERICGATMDASRETKDAVIAYLLEQTGNEGKCVMVGDTVYDVEGANVHGMDCIGVSWGFGDVQEMKDAGAAGIADTTEELLHLIED